MNLAPDSPRAADDPQAPNTPRASNDPQAPDSLCAPDDPQAPDSLCASNDLRAAPADRLPDATAFPGEATTRRPDTVS
ncbi:hypothetical protein [Kitasatospora sp. NPDC096204]|uniref:hypothetical protein n=1 Tax=Kitasatospora sp. NPDC096204 TaxID=3364094 RepID=UPI003829A43E